jgi:hypothetical protein
MFCPEPVLANVRVFGIKRRTKERFSYLSISFLAASAPGVRMPRLSRWRSRRDVEKPSAPAATASLTTWPVNQKRRSRSCSVSVSIPELLVLGKSGGASSL